MAKPRGSTDNRGHQRPDTNWRQVQAKAEYQIFVLIHVNRVIFNDNRSSNCDFSSVIGGSDVPALVILDRVSGHALELLSVLTQIYLQ